MHHRPRAAVATEWAWLTRWPGGRGRDGVEQGGAERLPTCWVVLTRALATPASLGSTPTRAVLLMGTNVMPMPKLTSISGRRTWPA